jgi:hypothetical protein
VRLLRSAILVLAALAGFPGCNNLEVCGSELVTMRDSSDAIYRCIGTEDCPLSARVSACVTDVSAEEECIRCENTVCVRVVPEAC